ncbi:lipopolysaccharide transport periplasmic protein LptA [Pseudothioclava nitratireducens]|jgi:lipopolysaccharide export system protein LptA|uniref:lipopolysaccharide transport periplasmic protein LptA n=1 Tax=Pseudothioclava nitratireducens TaxID=1928646 RepID=UPI0023DC9C7F|nr:lipopolysaccharide transport periplasmic protein LptA [Defluviimonas nitratireducens]MDF1620464.1 lipopolysaccharide transport periplasmic protein LptA [Defluviimonas nitratireducens]
MRPAFRLIALVLALSPLAATAQQVAFGGIRADTSQPVEVTADSLAVNQETGVATFSGNVLIGQGSMRLQAATVLVEYGQGDQSKINRLLASGGVTLVSEAEAAEAREAVYDVVKGTVVLTGDVLLTQGSNVMAGQKLSVDLRSGTGQMDGRVRTILQPGGN